MAGDFEIADELAEVLDALWGGQDAQTGDVVGAAAHQELDGAAQRTTGGQHRVEDVALTAGEVLGKTLGVGHRLEGLLVTGHADEADLGRRDEAHHALEHSQAGAQDRDDERLGAGQGDTLGGGERGGDGGRLDAHLAGALVSHEGDELLDELTEHWAGGVH